MSKSKVLKSKNVTRNDVSAQGSDASNNGTKFELFVENCLLKSGIKKLTQFQASIPKLRTRKLVIEDGQYFINQYHIDYDIDYDTIKKCGTKIHHTFSEKKTSKKCDFVALKVKDNTIIHITCIEAKSKKAAGSDTEKYGMIGPHIALFTDKGVVVNNICLAFSERLDPSHVLANTEIVNRKKKINGEDVLGEDEKPIIEEVETNKGLAMHNEILRCLSGAAKGIINNFGKHPHFIFPSDMKKSDIPDTIFSDFRPI